MQEYTNQFLSEENSDNKFTKTASKRLSKLRKRISTFSSSSRDSGVGFSDTENFLKKEDEQSNSINEPIYSSNRFVKLNKIKFAVKRFAGIGKENRRRHSEAYHQDGKTNPF